MATLGAMALAGAAWSFTGQPMPFENVLRTEGEATQASVTRVIDGDTITARDEQGRDLGSIRILGMDAPELARDGNPAMCGAVAAKKEATRVLDGADITLVTDTQQPSRDKYGRLLRYVDITHDGRTTDVTETLVRSGHAPNTSNASTHDRYEDYAAAEEDAKEHSRGVWSQCP